MSRLHLQDRLSGRLRGVADRIATEFGEEPVADASVPVESSQVVGTSQSTADSPRAAFVFSIRERLQRHPHFRGRASLVRIELVEGTIVLSGRLPSYYLKQLLQEAIRLMPGVMDIDNRVLVMRPDH
jgi:hypothetical protein